MASECTAKVDCPRCGSADHWVNECPEPMKCHNCDQEGHLARDCPHKVCNTCKQEGHFSRDCPEKVCENCKQGGHDVGECTNPRKIDRGNVQQTREEAWKDIIAAVAEKDIDMLKPAIDSYLNACPDITYVDLEGKFREQKLGIYLVAVEKPLLGAFTNMDTQGNLGKKYTVTYRWSDKAARPRERDLWPSSPEENLERLADAGVTVSSLKIKCRNCEEYGHSSRDCKEEKKEVERVVVTCFHCNTAGHRVRDCPEPRIDKFACKNCGQSGHGVKDCPVPRNAEGVECRKCNQSKPDMPLPLLLDNC